MSLSSCFHKQPFDEWMTGILTTPGLVRILGIVGSFHPRPWELGFSGVTPSAMPLSQLPGNRSAIPHQVNFQGGMSNSCSASRINQSNLEIIFAKCSCFFIQQTMLGKTRRIESQDVGAMWAPGCYRMQGFLSRARETTSGLRALWSLLY